MHDFSPTATGGKIIFPALKRAGKLSLIKAR